MKLNRNGALAFAGFVVFLAGRDIWWDWSLKNTESFAAFTTLLWAITALLSGMILAWRGRIIPLARRLQEPALFKRVAVYGGLSGGLYALGFFLVSRMGAGLFNMVEYSIYPIAVMALAVAWEKNRLEHHFAIDVVLYLFGLVLLLSSQSLAGVQFVALAALMPFITASTDYLTRYLLDPDRGRLSRSEVLFLRSLPAAIVVALYAIFFTANGLAITNVTESLLASILCGFLTLWCLNTALEKAEMKYLARWVCLVPALTFFGTLPLHGATVGNQQIVGAVVITLAWFLGYSGVTKRIWQRFVGPQEVVAPAVEQVSTSDK